jgi:hypothetical protein
MLIREGKRTKKMNLEKLNQMLKKTDVQGCESCPNFGKS